MVREIIRLLLLRRIVFRVLLRVIPGVCLGETRAINPIDQGIALVCFSPLASSTRDLQKPSAKRVGSTMPLLPATRVWTIGRDGSGA